MRGTTTRSVCAGRSDARHALHVLAVLPVLLVGALLVGCGSGGASDGTPTTVTGTGPAPSAGVATSRVPATAPLPTHVRGTAPAATTFLVDGRTVHFECHGFGLVPVVFLAGGGDPGTKWEPVLSRLGPDVLACTFDRPGVGGSDAMPEPLTPSTVGYVLDQTLGKADIGPQAVVVGHSLGGLNTVVFGGEHGNRLAGAVLVDATVPLALTAGDTMAIRALGYDPDQVVAQPGRVTEWPKVPLEVLTHDAALAVDGATPTFTRQEQDVWTAGQQRWAGLSSMGHVTEVPHTTHDVYIDDPDAVVAAIRRVLDTVRR